MNAHIHIGAVHVGLFALTLLIVGFFLRMLEGLTKDTAFGKALAFIY